MKNLKITIAPDGLVKITRSANMTNVDIIGIAELIRVKAIHDTLKGATTKESKSEITDLNNLPGKD